jgi:hypothetical protein
MLSENVPASLLIAETRCPGEQRTTSIQLASCPLYPQKQTCAVQLGMSALGQKRTLRHVCTTSAANRRQQR